jgi:hypothetical protein
MLVLEWILYLCSDVHVGIGVYVLAVTPYMLVVEFGGKVVRESDVDLPGREMSAD